MGLVFENKTFDNPNDLAIIFKKGMKLINCIIKDLEINNVNTQNLQWINSSFENCKINGLELQNCVFKDSRFIHSSLNHCEFKRCIFNGFTFESLDEAKLLEETNFKNCSFIDIIFKSNLKYCLFSSCDYESFHMSSIKLEAINFSGENMVGVDFKRSKFTLCEFNETNLQRANGRGSFDLQTQFELCLFKGAQFMGADFQFTKFKSCNFLDANFRNANLRRSAIDDTELEEMPDLSDALTDELMIDGQDYDVFMMNQDLNQGFLEEDEDEFIEHEGVAYEIHNAFHRINLPALVDYIRSHQFLFLPIDATSTDTFLGDIYGHFANVINKWYKNKPERRHRLLEQLDKVLDQIECIDFEYYMQSIDMPRSEFLQLILSFVMSQNPKFIRAYIKTFIIDSYEAYSSAEGDDSNISCPKGIIERFVLSLHTASIMLCPENFTECPSPYKELIRLLCSAVEVHLDWGKLQQDWYKSGVLEIPLENRKQNYIDYMTRHVDEICPINDSSREKIEKDAKDWEEAGLFSDENIEMFQMGGKVYLASKYFVN